MTNKRRAKESAKSFQMFQAYYNMGPTRTLAKLGKKYGLTPANMEKLSEKHKWQDRVKAMLGEEAERTAAADLAAKTELAKERERRKELIESTAWSMFLKLKEKVEKMLDHPIQTVRTTDEQGRNFTILPAKWAFADAAKMAQTADALARMSMGLPVTRGEITGAEGRALIPLQPPVIEIKYLSDKASEDLIEAAKPIVTKNEDE